MAKKLENRLYSFEKEAVKKLGKIPPHMPGENIYTSIAAKKLIISYANKLADIYHRDNAQDREYLKRVLAIKLYPATEVKVSKEEISKLNAEAANIYRRVKRELKKAKDGNAKYAALDVLKEAMNCYVYSILK